MTAAFNQMLAQGPTPIKFADPVNQMAQLMQLKNYQQTGVVNQMAIDKGNRQMADQAAYRNMLAQPGFNSTDPTTRAQVLGLGYGNDLTAMDASAKTQRDLAKTAYDERAASYKAGAPFNATAQQYLDYFDAGAQDPVLGAHWESNEGGIAPMRARLVQLLSTPEGLAHVREMAGGQTQAGKDAHDVAMGRIAKDNALAAKAGRPDAANVPQPPSGYRFGPDGNLIAIPGGPADRPVAPVKKDRENVGGIPFTVNEDGTFSPIVDPTTGKPFERVPSATEQKAKIAEENKNRGLLEAISNLDVLLGTEATDKTPKVPGVLDVSTSSGVGAAVDAAAQIFGKDTKGRIAIGEAEVLADAILKIIPRFEGPQSDKDTLSYKQAAGQLSNPNVGRETKIAAAKTLKRIFKERASQFTTQEEMDAGGTTPPSAGGAAAPAEGTYNYVPGKGLVPQ